MNEFKIIDTLGKISSGNGINLADSLSGIAIYEKKIALLFFSKESGYGDIKKYENLITESVNKEFANTTIHFDYTNDIKYKNSLSKSFKKNISQHINSDYQLDKWKTDGHKMLWHLDRVKDWQEEKKIAPLHIDMGFVNGCNMACTYCYGVIQNRAGYGTDAKNVFYTPKEKIINVFKEAKEIGVKSISIIGEGENTLHPDFYEILSYAKKIDLDIALSTNGIKIDNEKMDIFLDSLTWAKVNISAADPKSFKEIHKVAQFERVKKNIENLVKLRNKKSYKCTLGIQMVITKSNHDQIIPLAKLGAELGVDYCQVKPCTDTYDFKLDSMPGSDYLNLLDIFKEAETYSNEKYSVSVKWKKILNGGWKDYKTCFGTEFLINISGTGNVFPCCHWFDYRKDEFLMGNIIKTSLKDIVFSNRYAEVQKKIQTDVNVNKDCASNCRQHHMNRFLFHEGKSSTADLNEKYSEALSEKPNHINFI